MTKELIRTLDTREVEALAKAALPCKGVDGVRTAVYSWPRFPATSEPGARFARPRSG